jgi:hypothetical protein
MSYGCLVSNPSAPRALYDVGINVSFVSGTFQYFAETPGIGNNASYNGVFGIALDRTENYAFLSSAEGKRIRKLTLSSTAVGTDITRKYYAFA